MTGAVFRDPPECVVSSAPGTEPMVEEILAALRSLANSNAAELPTHRLRHSQE